MKSLGTVRKLMLLQSVGICSALVNNLANVSAALCSSSSARCCRRLERISMFTQHKARVLCETGSPKMWEDFYVCVQ